MQIVSKLGILLCTFIGASTIVIAEPLISVVPPIFLLAIRFTLAAALLGIVFPRRIFPVSKEAFHSGVVTGLGFGFGSALLYLALPHVRAGKLTFLIALEVVIVPLVCLAIYKQRLSFLEKVALIPATLGLWLLSGDTTTSFSWWEIVGLSSAFAYSVYTISLSHRASSGGVMSRTFVSFVTISILALGVSYLFEPVSGIVWTRPAAIGLAYLVVAGSFIRFIVQAWAQKSVSASFTALTFTAEPIFAIALSYTFLGERFTLAQTCGAACVIAALLIGNAPTNNRGDSMILPT